MSGAPVQVPFQPPYPTQQQNVGQPRPGGLAGTGGQPMANGAKQSQSSGFGSTEFVEGWTIRRPVKPQTWKDVTPLQQHISIYELKDEVENFEFRRKQSGTSVKDILDSLKSDSACRVVNELIDRRNLELWKENGNLQWMIGSIKVKREIVQSWPAGSKKIPKRIEIVLKTESRPDWKTSKGFQSQGANAKLGGGQVNKNNQQSNQNMPFDPHGDSQPMRGPQQGPGQGPPPGPLPPPSHGGQAPPGMVVLPPPPPPGPPKHTQGGPQLSNDMSGAFHSEPIVQGGRQEQVRVMHVDPDPRVLRKQKSRSRSRSRTKSIRLAYPDGSETGSDSETGSSSSDSRYSLHSIEGGYGMVGRSRSRGRKSDIRPRSRSRNSGRSHGHDHGSRSYKDKKSHGRSRSDFDHPSMGKHSSPHKDTSPRSSDKNLPTQSINIRINNDNEKEREGLNDRGRPPYVHDHNPRRSSVSISPGGFSNPPGIPNMSYKKQEKYTTYPMSRGSSFNGSDTDSSFAGTSSSVYTADDSVFSERPPPSRRHSRVPSEAGGQQLRSRAIPRPRPDSFMQQSFQEQPERRRRPQFPEPNDYPQARIRDDFDDLIEPQNRPSSFSRRIQEDPNPFDHTRFPARRSTSYDFQPREQDYVYPQAPMAPRYLAEKEHGPMDRHDMGMETLLDAMNHMMEAKKRHSMGGGMPARRGSVRVGMGVPMVEHDEWANHPRYDLGYPPHSGVRYV